MGLKERIENDLKNALRSGDSLRRSVLGMVKSAVQNKEIALGKKDEGLTEEEVQAVISTEAKKRKDAILEYNKAQRDDLAKKEEEELVILKDYLPEELSLDAVRDELKKVVEELGASGKENMGRVMGEAMKRLRGRVDGNVVRKELEKILE